MAFEYPKYTGLLKSAANAHSICWAEPRGHPMATAGNGMHSSAQLYYALQCTALATTASTGPLHFSGTLR